MTKEKKPALLEVSQRAIIYDRATKKFLFAKYAPETARNHEQWGLIGGRMDEGEADPVKVLKREIAEEVGDIEYDVDGIVDAHVDGRCRLGHLVYYKGGDITLSGEHSEYAWMTAEEIEKEKDFRPGVKQFIHSATAKMKSAEYLDDLKRLQADFENYKKRQAESQKELGGYLIEKLLFDIIPVLDNFRMATGHVPEDAKDSPWVVGIQYIEKQLEDALKSHGVEAMEVKEGDAFDPNIHEAVGPELVEGAEKNDKEEGESDEEKKEVVAKVLQNGYKIGGRVVRPAKVTVK